MRLVHNCYYEKDSLGPRLAGGMTQALGPPMREADLDLSEEN